MAVARAEIGIWATSTTVAVTPSTPLATGRRSRTSSRSWRTRGSAVVIRGPERLPRGRVSTCPATSPTPAAPRPAGLGLRIEDAHADELAVLHRDHVRDHGLDGCAACSARPVVAGDGNHSTSPESRFMFAPGEKLEPAHHDLHVLLRHRLLRQPDGFEGVRGIEVGPRSNDAASFQLVDDGELQLHRHPASLAGRPLPQQADNAIIARVDQLLYLQRPTVEVLGPHAHELDEPITTAIARGRPGDLGRRYPLGVLTDCSRIETGTKLAALHPRQERFEQPPRHLHVLLRHRPPSIPFDLGSANGERGPPRREGRRQSAARSSWTTLSATRARRWRSRRASRSTSWPRDSATRRRRS